MVHTWVSSLQQNKISSVSAAYKSEKKKKIIKKKFKFCLKKIKNKTDQLPTNGYGRSLPEK